MRFLLRVFDDPPCRKRNRTTPQLTETSASLRNTFTEAVTHDIHGASGLPLTFGAKDLPRSTHLRQAIERVGLFNPIIYLDMHADVKADRVDAWEHFLTYGITEGRRFTTPELVARAFSHLAPEIDNAIREGRERLHVSSAAEAIKHASLPLARRGLTVAVYCNSHGNFYMQEIANLLFWQLTALGIQAHQRTEEAPQGERFDIRIFVAPHEFFWLGRGEIWKSLAKVSGSVLFNVEQVQTPWFCKGFPLLLEAPLVLDISLQSASLLRHLGINSLHYMPPYIDGCKYTTYQEDVSHIEIIRGYEFSRKLRLTKAPVLHERPLDILFVGTGCERRLKAMQRLRDLTDRYRFLCVYTNQTSPLTAGTYRTTSPEINCALAQRSKIVLNIHRDWIGYFEWSRMAMQGFWQSACVVSDPSLADPVFRPSEHFLEENARHLPELLDWLLGTEDGRKKMEGIAKAGHEHAKSLPARAAMLIPMLTALRSVVR